MKSLAHSSRVLFLLIILLSITLLPGCSKETGDDDDDDGEGDGDDDDGVPQSGVGSYTLYLNMVPEILGVTLEPEERTVYGPDGASVEVPSILVSDWIATLNPFAEDADDFTYEFVNRFDATIAGTKAGLPTLSDLEKAAFYEDAENERLCVGWLESGKDEMSLCDMEGGALVTHPIDGAIDYQTIEWVNDREGDQPANLGQMVALTGVATLGTGTIVSGSYVKVFVQDSGWGVKIFADMGATIDNNGYDGAKFQEYYVFEGDEVFVLGRITEHDGMIEFVPKSGYHTAVLSRANQTPDPVSMTVQNLVDDPYRYAGVLVRVDDLNFTDILESDPTTDWPVYGTKSKEIRVRNSGGGPKMGLPIYEGTGIPGSPKPAEPFNAVGVFNIGSGYNIYPRKIEDINPTTTTLEGTIRVSIYGEDKMVPIMVENLQAGTTALSEGEDPVPVISIASIIRAAGISRNAKALEYKHIASDGRKPFETYIFDIAKHGMLYQEEVGKGTTLASSFWEGLNLSEIYYLHEVTDIQAFRDIEPPDEGDAEFGKGVTLKINGRKFAINFEDFEPTTYDGKDAIPVSSLVPDSIIDQFTMGGSFSTNQIRILYDYNLISHQGDDEALIRYENLGDGYVVPADPPYAIFPDLDGGTQVDEIYTIDMMRYIEVDDGTGSDPYVVYLRDLETQEAEVEDGQTEDVVFFETVLQAAGIDTTQNMYLYNFLVYASDQFGSLFPFGHNHLVDMFFRPYENKGYTVDPDIGEYGGRVSTKAVLAINLIDVPQDSPSIPVEIDGQTLWGTDAETCEGCHYKSEAVQIAVDCYSCHSAP